MPIGARQQERPKTLREMNRKEIQRAQTWIEVSETPTLTQKLRPQKLTPEEEAVMEMDLFGDDSDSPTEPATDRAAQEAALAFKELTAEEQQHLMGLAAQRRKDKSMDGDLFAPEPREEIPVPLLPMTNPSESSGIQR